MLCTYPLVMSRERIHGCGQCLACRVNQSRKWATRISLESKISKQTWFGTLTYDEENVPDELSKPDIQGFFKRVRHPLSEYSGSVRYYATGEYGSRTKRPHYHFLLFIRGIPLDDYTVRGAVAKSWSMGRSQCKLANSSVAYGYVSKYVTKKATNEWDQEKPEWHLSSRNPGLGSEAVAGICESLLHYGYFDGEVDVPSHIQIDDKAQPLDYYIRNLMRDYMRDTYGMECDSGKRVKEFALSFDELWNDYSMALHAAEKLGCKTARFGMYANFGARVASQYVGKRDAFEKRVSMRRKTL